MSQSHSGFSHGLALRLAVLWVLLVGGAILLAQGVVRAVPLHVQPPDFVSDEILVRFAPGASNSSIKALLAQHKATEKTQILKLGVRVLKVPDGQVEAITKILSVSPLVEFVELNYIAVSDAAPNDVFFSEQWGMSKIKAPAGWDITRGLAGVKIAILDTGIDQDHPDLAGKVVANANFTSSSSADDVQGHGTHVAGIAAALTGNSVGVVGVAADCRLMNGKVLGDNGQGDYDWIASGICWAADNGAKVVNMSLSGGGASETLRSAVDYAWNKGVVVVAAAGNQGNTGARYPAYYTNCIAVGATDQADQRAYFSNYGNAWVDVAAPGVSTFSTLPNHTSAIGSQVGSTSYGAISGTSMAAPHVAGLAALVWASGYGTSNTAVRGRIEATCVPIGAWLSKGRIDALRALCTPISYGVQILSNGQQVNFPEAYLTPPVVLTSSQTVSSAASSVTKTGFKINLTSDSGTAVNGVWVEWIAFIPLPSLGISGGTLSADAGSRVAFPTMPAYPVIVTNAVKSGKALITNAMDNSPDGFYASILNDRGQSVQGASLSWMAVVPGEQSGFVGEVARYNDQTNVTFSPAFANGPAYVLSATGAIAGAVNNRNDGFFLRLTSDSGGPANGPWVQWLGYAAP